MPVQTAQSAGQSAAVTALRERFRTVRAATLRFTAPLSPEDLMVQSSPDASPVKWHLAHTSWFFETFVLVPYAPGYQAFHPDFHWLFNSYYTSLGDMPAKNLRSSFSRPPLSDILSYRTHTDAALEDLLGSIPAEHEDDILRRVALGLEHEQQHLELIATDIKHALFTNPLHPAYKPGAPGLAPETWESAAPNSEEAAFTSFSGGITEIGVSPEPTDPLAFAFDNETPRHKVYLQPFQLANRLVTTREFLAFIDDNGYTRPELWLSEGWSTMRAAGWQAPLYWTRSSDTPAGWRVFTLHGYQPLERLLDTPVCHLSLFEADAYARWAGCRLPTEFEWEHAASSSSPSTGSPSPSTVSPLPSTGSPSPFTGSPSPGTGSPSPSSLSPLLSSRSEAEGSASPPANMLESNALQPTPAAEAPGLQQLFGDTWEWTSSGYTGYPGYRPLPGALGEYNGKFMSSQVILRGGSCVTPATHIRATYRNFFPPATRWQFSGVRLAKDL